MLLTILLSLLIALAVVWAVLALIRERAIVAELHVERALGERYLTAELERLTVEHNRAIEHYRRGELPRLSEGPAKIDPAPIPEWMSEFVKVEVVDHGEQYHYRQTVGRALASVSAWFFHGAFAVGHVVLAGLALVEGWVLWGS